MKIVIKAGNPRTDIFTIDGQMVAVPYDGFRIGFTPDGRPLVQVTLSPDELEVDLTDVEHADVPELSVVNECTRCAAGVRCCGLHRRHVSPHRGCILR